MDSICCHAAWKKPAVSAIQKHRYAPEFLLILPFPSPCQETVRIFDSILLLPANCSARRRELPVLLSRFSFGLDFNLIIGLFFAKPVSRADPSPPQRQLQRLCPQCDRLFLLDPETKQSVIVTIPTRVTGVLLHSGGWRHPPGSVQ